MDNFLIKYIIKKNKIAMAALSTLLFFSQIITVYGADLMRRIMDDLVQNERVKENMVILYAVVMLGQCGVSFAISYYGELMLKKSVLMMQRDFLIKYGKSNIGEKLSRENQGEMFQIACGDLSVVTRFCVNTFVGMIQTVTSFLIASIYLFFLRWEMFIIIMILNPLLLFVQSIIAPVLKKKSEQLRKSVSAVVNAMQELFSNPIDIKMSGLQNAFIDRVKSALQSNYVSDKKATLVQSISGTFAEFMVVVGHLCVFIYGCYLVAQGKIGVGEIVVFITYASKIMGGFERISHFTVDYSAIEPNVERITPYYEKSDYVEEGEILENCFDISFENVTFAYQTGKKILDDASYRFQYGKRYGIIGETGAGKSTIAKLICGIWKPNQGKIMFGDAEIRNVRGSEFEKRIAYYPAVPIIIQDTIYANASLGKENANAKKVAEVLDKMLLSETISKNVDKYNTRIGIGGCTLSAGEKQRLGLSRALLSTKNIVIIDEPTAFLDDITKKHVMREVMRYNKNALLIIISHDLDILRECDDIIQIKNGKMLSCGNGI